MHRPDWFSLGIEWAAMLIELIGVAVILVGGVVVLVWFTVDRVRTAEQRENGLTAYGRLRQRLGRVILLGLEFLVAADIIATVMIDPTLEAVASLAVVVLIRTFLSWSLEVELEGRWPWQGKAHSVSR
jgi:uncharacterized membrane protein